MRCLPHVFLRGGLALLLLASAGAGALSQSTHACADATHASPAAATSHARC